MEPAAQPWQNLRVEAFCTELRGHGAAPSLSRCSAMLRAWLMANSFSTPTPMTPFPVLKPSTMTLCNG